MIPPRAAPTDAHAINLRWLLQLRWGAMVGQSLVVLLVDQVLRVPLALGALFGVIAVEAASNVLIQGWLRRVEAREGAVAEWVLGAVMTLDVLLLTVLLHLSGGSYNPFNFLYLVEIALAAVVLRGRWTWGLVVLSAVCFASLFLDLSASHGAEMQAHGHGDMALHLRGMWVAFTIAAAFIVYFVGRIRRALRERDEELVRIRERTARGEKLASLATLAAGAAHELSTPLATIAVAAGEIDESLARGNLKALEEDAKLIRQEVRRCRVVLDQMATEAGDAPGEAPASASLAALAADAVAAAKKRGAVAISDADAAGETEVRVPRSATIRALRGLVDNALDAVDGDTDKVEVCVGRQGDECWLEVRDEGPGMDAETLDRAGEPFFTTKEPGRGMGLGLFLVEALADRLGGRLELQSSPGAGTVARLVLPVASDATIHPMAGATPVVES
jgi:two-component system sensor histidine kinase RegB